MKPTRYVRMKLDCILVYPKDLKSLPPMATLVGSGVLSQAIADALEAVSPGVEVEGGARFTFSLHHPKGTS